MNDLPSDILLATSDHPKLDLVAGSIEKPVDVAVVEFPTHEVEIQPVESDARHEPVDPPVDALMDTEDASVVPQIDTPTDPDHIPGPPANGTPAEAEDAKMEDIPHTNGVNGDHVDTPMDADTTPVTTPGMQVFSGMSNGASTSHTSPADDDQDDVQPPPAKRARVHSDADQASLAHKSASPPPTSAAPTPIPPAPDAAPPADAPMPLRSAPPLSTLSTAQHKFCLSTIRSLKKQKDGQPFIHPVDTVALQIPHYNTIIKTPMDFSTIERKLMSSNPTKPDPNLDNPRYYSADEFVADVRTVFGNCYTFNGPDHGISHMAKRLEEVFDKQIKHLPPIVEPKPVVQKAESPVPPPPVAAPAPAKKAQPRRPSTSVPVIRRTEGEGPATTRPKREIHPPPPKDLPYADLPKKRSKPRRAKDDITGEQLRFCGKILQELNKKQHYAIASPFYEPVDPVVLDLPTYFKIIKKPMDLSTMRKKLDNAEYPSADKFYDDFKLMIRNCFTFNPAGTLVNQAGQELQKLFDERWQSLPQPRSPSPRRVESDDESEDDDSDDQNARAIAMMESQIENMRNSINALKSKSALKKQKQKEKRDRDRAAVSKSTPKAPKASSAKTPSKPSKKGKKSANGALADDDVLTFDQKKELSESITALEGPKLERVIQIIHDGMPEIRDSNEEIELEIDLLPAAVLTKLYNFVVRPNKVSAASHTTGTKRARSGKGTGTGGLKRKSMDEDVEAAKIRQLEERMALFEQGTGVPSAAPAAATAGDSESSDSSDSNSSGSDSE